MQCTEDVYDLIAGLDCNKSTGPDDISPKMLKGAATSVTVISQALNSVSYREHQRLCRLPQANNFHVQTGRIQVHSLNTKNDTCYRKFQNKLYACV